MTEEEFKKREKIALIFVEIFVAVIGLLVLYILFT
jgi:hypothetical protein